MLPGGRWWLVPVSVMAAVVGVFLAVEALHVEMLSDPRPTIAAAGWLAAPAGVALLVADVVLPVPSSLVMVAHGALFGVVGGSVLSLVGSTGAFLTGFALGRRSAPVVARVVPETERRSADRVLERWGSLAILVTRPVPVMAETVAVVAGASSLGWRRAVAAAAVGSLPGALLYALAGSAAADLGSASAVFAVVVLLGAAMALVTRRSTDRTPRRRSQHHRAGQHR